jgi:hypothetical protein
MGSFSSPLRGVCRGRFSGLITGNSLQLNVVYPACGSITSQLSAVISEGSISGTINTNPVPDYCTFRGSFTAQRISSTEVSEREPNDTPDTADIVFIPVMIRNGFASPRDCSNCWCFDENNNDRCDSGEDLIEDWYWFAVSQPITITVTLAAPNPTAADFDLAISRYIPNPTRLTSIAGAFNPGTPPESFTVSLEPGIYVIPVSNFDRGPTTPSAYTLTITLVSNSPAELNRSEGFSHPQFPAILREAIKNEGGFQNFDGPSAERQGAGRKSEM